MLCIGVLKSMCYTQADMDFCKVMRALLIHKTLMTFFSRQTTLIFFFFNQQIIIVVRHVTLFLQDSIVLRYLGLGYYGYLLKISGKMTVFHIEQCSTLYSCCSKRTFRVEHSRGNLYIHANPNMDYLSSIHCFNVAFCMTST